MHQVSGAPRRVEYPQEIPADPPKIPALGVPGGSGGVRRVLICLGTMIASSGVLSVGGVGLALQLGANSAEASRVVLPQQLLATRKLPLLELQHHIAPSQVACLLLAALQLELRDAAARAAALRAVAAHPPSFLLASNLGLALQVATLVVVRTSGPATLKLLGIVRNAAVE